MESANFANPELLAKDKEGPWVNGRYDRKRDLTLFRQLGQGENTFVRVPDRLKLQEKDSKFIRINNLQTYYFGQRYTYDLFTTRQDIWEGLDAKSGKPKFMQNLALSNLISTEQIAVRDKFSLPKSLNRVRIAALSKKNDESLEALTLLHNIASGEKRIAVINSHGRVATKDGVKTLVISSDDSTEVEANTLIAQISGQTENFFAKKYSAIYFNSCNEERKTGESADVLATTIPVVVHTRIHRASNFDFNPAKIYWPPEGRVF